MSDRQFLEGRGNLYWVLETRSLDWMGCYPGCQVRQTICTATDTKLCTCMCGLGCLALFEILKLTFWKLLYLANSRPVSSLNCLLCLISITESYSYKSTHLFELKIFLNQSPVLYQAYIEQILNVNSLSSFPCASKMFILLSYSYMHSET